MPSDDKKRARLAVIRHILKSIPYQKVKLDKVEFPKRKVDRDYKRPTKFPTELVPG